MYIYIYVCMYIHVYTYIITYIHIYIYIYTYTHIHVYIYTYIHTYLREANFLISEHLIEQTLYQDDGYCGRKGFCTTSAPNIMSFIIDDFPPHPPHLTLNCSTKRHGENIGAGEKFLHHLLSLTSPLPQYYFGGLWGGSASMLLINLHFYMLALLRRWCKNPSMCR